MSYSPHELAASAAGAPAGSLVVDMTVEEMIALYRDIRDNRLPAIKERYKAETEPLEAVKDLLEKAIHTEMNRTGTQSFKTPAGTAFQQTHTKYAVEDAGVFRQWLADNQMFNLLETRISKDALESFMLEHPTLPPGIKVRSETVVQVRK